MKTIHNKPKQVLDPCVATIGFFDGIHRGHQYLIKQLKDIAQKKQLKTAIITFTNHPKLVIHKDYKLNLITSSEKKVERLNTTGIDYCYLMDFNLHLSEFSAKEFMNDVLKTQYNVKELVIGYDHRFGHNRQEGFEDYVNYGKELGINITLAKELDSDNEEISSSIVRGEIKEGNIIKANQLLGYPFNFNGKVTTGNQIGRKLGFPTANITPDFSNQLIPQNGVYGVNVYLKKRKYAGMLNIGHRPTVTNGKEKTIEVHILHFDETIYGEEITLEFLYKLRNEVKFSSTEELKEQLTKDKQHIESYLKA